jgi:hypothetical protein
MTDAEFAELLEDLARLRVNITEATARMQQRLEAAGAVAPLPVRAKLDQATAAFEVGHLDIREQFYEMYDMAFSMLGKDDATEK